MEKIKNTEITPENPELSADFESSAGKMALLASELERLAEAERIPKWKEYVDGFTDEELLNGEKANGEQLDFSKLNRTADDFRVNYEDYPIFNRQTTFVTATESKRWNIDKILSQYLVFTADTIGAMDGHLEGEPKTDEVIYLDKSARPVSHLVNNLWNDFAIKNPETGEPVERPEESFLNVDRVVWFRRVGIPVDDDMYMEGADGTKRKASINDFRNAIEKGALKKEDIAAIRALYIEGGTTTDDVDEIMKMPTRMDGKNIKIIDEVSDTGATAEVARILISAAFPEAESVSTHIFSSFGAVILPDGQRQMAGSPVWYPVDHSYEYGRGVLDRNDEYWKANYENNPTPENYAKMKGSFVLSQPMDLEAEPGQPSKELFREIDQLAKDYRDGKILFRAGSTREWQDKEGDRTYIAILRQGIHLQDRNYVKILEEIDARPAPVGFSTQFPLH